MGRQGFATILSGLALSLSLTGSALSQVVPRTEVYPPHEASFPAGVVGLPDLMYQTIPGYRPMKLDLYKPAAPGPKPLVIYVHGGGWTGGTQRLAGTFDSWPAVLARLAARGYVVASVSYRLSGEARFPAAIQDVKASIRWLRANADKYDIDASRVLLWGGSAGGQLVALAGTSCGVATLSPLPNEGSVEAGTVRGGNASDCVQGVVDFYGISDLAAMDAGVPINAPLTTVGQYLGCQAALCAPSLVASANPITYVDPKDPPFLLVHGTKDRTVPYAQSELLAAALRAKGVPVELRPIPDADHSFVMGSPEKNATVNDQVLAKVFAFIDATIGKPAK